METPTLNVSASKPNSFRKIYARNSSIDLHANFSLDQTKLEFNFLAFFPQYSLPFAWCNQAQFHEVRAA
jgi:hypothetical protein